MTAKPRNPKLPPLQLCRTHGRRFRAWREGALPPCCAEDRQVAEFAPALEAFCAVLARNIEELKAAFAWERAGREAMQSKTEMRP